MKKRFPGFYNKLKEKSLDLEMTLPPLTEKEIVELEKNLGIKLPESYKDFLSITRGFYLMDLVRIEKIHPFFHTWSSKETLSAQNLEIVKQRGGIWPPPTEGMLCFADFYKESDGDQLLFDVSKGLINREYPIFYYAHENTPPSVTKISDSFEQWINEFLKDVDFSEE